MLKAECLEEARFILNKPKEDTEEDHVGCIDYGLFDQMSTFPVSELVEKHCDDLVTIITMVPEKRLTQDDATKGGRSISVDVIIVTLLQEDLTRIVSHLITCLPDRR